MVEPEIRALAADLSARLDATAELPMKSDVTHWVAEADAVASDVAEEEVPHDVLRKRLGHVQELLSHVEETGHPEADEHVAAAKRLTDDALARLG